jgi:hypothetical protein
MNDTPKTLSKIRSPCFCLFFCGMCSLFVFRCLSFTAGCCFPLVSQAQIANVTAVPGSNTMVYCVPATLFKLGTGLTRSLNIGGHLDFSLPLMAGLERQCAPDWSAYGNMSSGWRIGNREQATSAWDQPSALVSELGADIGLRHYYRQAQRWPGRRCAWREITWPCRPAAALFRPTVLSLACTATIIARRFCGVPSAGSVRMASLMRT